MLRSFGRIVPPLTRQMTRSAGGASAGSDMVIERSSSLLMQQPASVSVSGGASARVACVARALSSGARMTLAPALTAAASSASAIGGVNGPSAAATSLAAASAAALGGLDDEIALEFDVSELRARRRLSTAPVEVFTESHVVSLLDGALATACRAESDPALKQEARRLAFQVCELYCSLAESYREHFYLDLIRAKGGNDTQKFAYKSLLKTILELPGGPRLLVDMRGDLLSLVHQNQLDAASVEPIDQLGVDLRNILKTIIVGHTHLTRLSWNTSAAILEKVMGYEAVHPMNGWNDLKRRIGRNRICFSYFVPLLPGEPLIVLHTALMTHRADNIHKIFEEPHDSLASPIPPTWAIFFSSSASHKGLSGVGLGHDLIMEAVAYIKKRHPTVKNFATLSPIPRFRMWLTANLAAAVADPAHPFNDLALTKAELSVVRRLESLSAKEYNTPAATLQTILGNDDWSKSHRISEALRAPMLRLASHYVNLKVGKSSYDPVAAFHIGNGATAGDINWMANASPRGMAESYGLMINYRYLSVSEGN